MDAFEILTALSILLLVGIALTYLSRRLKIPNVFLLIIAGIIISFIKIQGEKVVSFSRRPLSGRLCVCSSYRKEDIKPVQSR